MVPGGDLGATPGRHGDGNGGGRPGDAVLGFQLGESIAVGSLQRGGIRGRLLRLGPAADEILTRHDYPDEVSRLLGEALGMATLLAETLKFDGIFTLQARGEGPVPLLVADYRKPGLLRGHASLHQERYDRLLAGPSPKEPVPRLLGGGLLSFTVDQGGRAQRYQGIVELAGGSLADCANAYFQQSEQLDTVLRLAAGRVPEAGDEGADAGWRIGGILLQRLPRADHLHEDDAAADDWPRALTMLGSARDEELLDPLLSGEALLYRLFHEDGVRVFEPQRIAAHCTCSRPRILQVLQTFSEAERADMVVDGEVTVTCEFCNRSYAFSPDELAGGVAPANDAGIADEDSADGDGTPGSGGPGQA
ncbi:MAG: Hsp33 family molecular chaperone HslO [Sneathiellaceae bacterium]